MLLTLQTTDSALDENTLDAVTLVLLVVFVLSMVALSVLLTRRGKSEDADALVSRPPEPSTPPLQPPQSSSARFPVPASRLPEMQPPAWLTGVDFPQTAGQLAEITSVIERLLDARRRLDLESALALFSPSYRSRLADELGVPASELEAALSAATIQGDAPTLRAIELLSASGHSISVRAGYGDKSAEVYRLVRLDGSWVIDSIERG